MNAKEIRNVTVVGGGLMGHGIALEFAVAGYDVTLNSRTEESISNALDMVRDNLDMMQSLGLLTAETAESAPSRIIGEIDLPKAVEQADVVIEAVYEDLELKRSIFETCDRYVHERTILASTTSTYVPSSLAAATERPDRFIVAHFINPPHLVPLVELVRSEQTSEETIEIMWDLLQKIGKRPALIQKEVPGFVANRLQSALLREALWLVDRGVISAPDLDVIVKTSIGRRWAVAGPFEIFELAGWDLVRASAPSIFPFLENSHEIPPILDEMVARGELGIKAGKGFYEWTPETGEALRQRVANALVEIEKWSQSKQPD